MLNSTPATYASGEALTSAKLNTEIRDALTGLQSAWQAWSPALTASTTNPTLGSGSTSGRYQRVGKDVHFEGRVSLSGACTFGAGTWYLSLPIAATASGAWVNGVVLVYPGAGSWVQGWLRPQDATKCTLYVPNTATTALLSQVSSTSTPGGTAWAAGTQIQFWALYESA